MYIRRTTTKSRKDGAQYYTYRLVESKRHENGVRQHTLLNLGADFSLHRQRWPELTKRIHEILSGQLRLIPASDDIESLAQTFAAKILTKHNDFNHTDTNDYQEVDLNTLETIRPRSVGTEHVSLEALLSLKLDTMLQKLGFNGPQTAAAIGTILGRACEPGSELSTYAWFKKRSALGELIDFDYSGLSLYQMYNASDRLLKNKQAIEEHLFKREKSLFGLKETITLYDLTNTYFEGQSKDNGLAAHGHSKEKRADCPLVTLALVLDSHGFPRRSQVFKGNVSEPKTLAQMICGLKSHHKLTTKPTVVLDAGIATEQNIAWLKENHYTYLVVSRKKHREFDTHSSQVVKQDKECIVRAHKVFDEQTQETLLYCHSTLKEKKEQAITSRFVKRFEEELKKLRDGLHKKRCLKKYDKVMVKIGRLREKYAQASKQFTITVDRDDTTQHATKITWQQKPEPNTKDTYPGVYCLRTNLNHWDQSCLWDTYTMLTDLEAVFRSLKSELGLRPIHHQTDKRVAGHLFITVLAYHLVHTIRFKLKQKGIVRSWSSIRKILSNQCRITVCMQCKDKSTIHVRKSTRPEPEQQEIYTALGVKPYPGTTKKMVYV